MSQATPPTAAGPRALAVVAVAYLGQGLVAAVGLVLLSVLAQIGLPLDQQVGILATGALPWVLKFGLALLLDLGPSWPLRVRGVLISALLGCAAACVWGLSAAWSSGAPGAGASAEASAGPGSIVALALGWVALNACVAVQDVLVDGLALDTLATRRAWTAAAMSFGHVVGTALGPMVLVRHMATAGVASALALPAWGLAALALAPALLLWIPGRPIRAREQPEAKAPRSARDLARLAWLPVVFVALTFAGNLTTALSFEFLYQHLQIEATLHTDVLIPVAVVAGVVGAFGFGPVVARLGPAQASMVGAAGLGLAWLAFAALAPAWDQPWTLVVLAGGEGLLQPALLVGLHALALLAAARSPMPITAFVIAMAALNLSRVLAPLAAPAALELGWVGVFVLCGVAQLIAAVGLAPARGWAQQPKPDDAGCAEAPAQSPDTSS